MRFSVVTGFFGEGALAEDEPPLPEVSLRYQMPRLNSSRSIPSFIANGGTSSFPSNFIDHRAAIAELGVEHDGNIHKIQLDNTSLSKRSSRVVPAFECLLGGVNDTGRIKSPLLPDIPGARITGGQNALATAVGVTLDIRCRRRLPLWQYAVI
jgi:hypothetical protein